MRGIGIFTETSPGVPADAENEADLMQKEIGYSKGTRTLHLTEYNIAGRSGVGVGRYSWSTASTQMIKV